MNVHEQLRVFWCAQGIWRISAESISIYKNEFWRVKQIQPRMIAHDLPAQHGRLCIYAPVRLNTTNRTGHCSPIRAGHTSWTKHTNLSSWVVAVSASSNWKHIEPKRTYNCSQPSQQLSKFLLPRPWECLHLPSHRGATNLWVGLGLGAAGRGRGRCRRGRGLSDGFVRLHRFLHLRPVQDHCDPLSQG